MAARKEPRNPPQSYELQRAKQLLNRLSKCAKGEVKMSSTAVKAAQIVIGKEIPDKKAIEHSTDPDKPMRGVLVWGDPE